MNMPNSYLVVVVKYLQQALLYIYINQNLNKPKLDFISVEPSHFDHSSCANSHPTHKIIGLSALSLYFLLYVVHYFGIF